jgi:hypothetical protein
MKEHTLVVVERHFDEPMAFEELEAREARHSWCLEVRGVVFQRTLMSPDGRRMLCLYRAPDAESVREAQREAGLPFTTVWAAEEKP